MNKVRKIIIISVVLGLVGLVAITTLILALVPVNKNRTIETPNAIYITNEKTANFNGGFNALSIDENTAKRAKMLNDFMKAFNSGFEQKALVSLFNGQMNEGFEAGYSNKAASSETISKNYDTTEKFTVIFEYNETKTITVEEKGLTFEYDHLFFEVTNTDERELVTFGVMKGTSYMGGEESKLPYQYYYTAKVNLRGLYDYIRTISVFKTN